MSGRTHPFRSKLKSPMPATTQPATTSSTEAVIARGGAFLFSRACHMHVGMFAAAPARTKHCRTHAAGMPFPHLHHKHNDGREALERVVHGDVQALEAHEREGYVGHIQQGDGRKRPCPLEGHWRELDDGQSLQSGEHGSSWSHLEIQDMYHVKAQEQHARW